MAEPPSGFPVATLVVHAVGFFLLAGLLTFLTWLQYQVMGERGQPITVVMALVVLLLVIQGVRRVRAALRAVRQAGG